MPELHLVSLCSALTIALFFQWRGAILARQHQRAVFGLLLCVVGALALPSFSVFAPAITLCWIAFAVVALSLLRVLLRIRRPFRQFWITLDFISAGSLFAAGVYSLSEIVLGVNTEAPRLTLLVSLLTIAACTHTLHELDRASVLQRPAGLVFGETLLITGGLPCCFGLHRVDSAAILCLLFGAFVLMIRLRSFFRTTEERRILSKMSQIGEALQPEYTEPSLECPEPRLWSMYDPMTAEKEVLDLLYAIVRAVKPRLAVETGTFSGISSSYIARAMKENGRGRLITCETDPVLHENACERFRGEGLSSLIDCRLTSSLELEVNDEIDLLYCDSDPKVRGEEVRRFIRDVNPFGLILIHDAGSRFKVVREAALRMEMEGLISVVLVSTPRGLVIAQRREGRN